MRAQLHVSERRACAALGQHRSTQRKVPRGREDEERLTADIIELARQYGRYGYRKIAGLLPSEACGLNHSIGPKMPFDSSANLAFVAPISANNMCSGEEAIEVP